MSKFYSDLVEYYCCEFEKKTTHKDKMILSRELEELDNLNTDSFIMKNHVCIYLNADLFHKEKKLASVLGIGFK